jgi:hypothetical protein
MPRLLRCGIVLIATGVLLTRLPFLAMADGDDSPQPTPRATESVEPPPGQRISLSFAPVSSAANAVASNVLLARADEIIDSAKAAGADGEQDTGEIELRENVTLWFKDGSVKAKADQGVIVPNYARDAEATIESFDVKLIGNVRWKSPGFSAWSNELTVSLRPAAQEERSSQRFSKLRLTDQARIDGDEFAGKAESIVVDFVAVKTPRGKSLRLTLDGLASMSRPHSGRSTATFFEARRIEFIPEISSLKIDSLRAMYSSE